MEASEEDVAVMRKITGMNVTDMRILPPDENAPETYIDGHKTTPNNQIQLQIDGEWSEPAPGVYTVSAFKWE